VIVKLSGNALTSVRERLKKLDDKLIWITKFGDACRIEQMSSMHIYWSIKRIENSHGRWRVRFLAPLYAELERRSGDPVAQELLSKLGL
jgi:hypothetical protein